MKALVVTVTATVAGGTYASPNGTLLVAGGASSGGGMPQSSSILVPSAGQTVFVGGPDVDSTNGFPVAPGGELSFDTVNEPLYGIVASGTQAVNVLRRGN